MICIKTKQLSWLAVMISLSACTKPGVQTGGSASLISGSAGGSTSVNANKTLEHCASPLGTLAVSDGRITGASAVTTVDPLIRLAVQQSNCFVITGIGNQATLALLNAITSQQRESGEYRAGSKQQKGQRVAADYLLEPQVIVLNESTQGNRAGLYGGGMHQYYAPPGQISLGGIFVDALAGAAASAADKRSTDVALTLIDIRSTVQIGISQGSATANALQVSGWGGFLGENAAGGFGLASFTRTPEGISTAAAFFDAYNNLVQSLRNYKAQEVKDGAGTGGQLQFK
ncbi:hypothetical protein [Methylomonas sp. MK1]|uniref:hypothetical protein n=1 Tax=Methylomonas sp. MK1 TaxID=1131552 RepID=UPI000365D5D5|nr:hypothetical protein [Methylomonas sp. MK1]